MELNRGRFMKRSGSSIIKLVAIVSISTFPVIGFVTAHRGQYSAGSVAQPSQGSTGRELFMNNCARCHGDDAKGDKGPDLTSPKRQSKWANSEEPLIAKITKGGLFMPKFGKKLSPQDIKDIADYVRSLGK